MVVNCSSKGFRNAETGIVGKDAATPQVRAAGAPRRGRFAVAAFCRRLAAAGIAGKLALALAAASLGHLPPAHGAVEEVELWSTTLNVTRIGTSLAGCQNTSSVSLDHCTDTSRLPDDDFNLSDDSTDYSILGLFAFITDAAGPVGTVRLRLSPILTEDAGDGLTLHLGTTKLAFADAARSAFSSTTPTQVLYQWPDAGVTWTNGQNVAVRITGIGGTFLSGLTLADGSTDIPLSTAFTAGNLNYTARVGAGTSQITVTLTPGASDGTYKLLDARGVEIPDAGRASGHQVDLHGGTNVIRVRVTDTEGATNYTLRIFRPVPVVGNTAGRFLVSNFHVSATDEFGLGRGFRIAQTFTTGQRAAALTGITVRIKTGYVNGAPTAKLVKGGADGTEVARLTGPASLYRYSTDDYTFTAPAGTTLDARADYTVLVEGNIGTWFQTTKVLATSSGRETRSHADTTPGWAIADTSSTTYPAYNGFGPFRSRPYSFLIRVNGIEETRNSPDPASCGPEPAGEAELWCATMTVGEIQGAIGYLSGSDGTGSLSRSSFELSGRRHTVHVVGDFAAFSSQPAKLQFGYTNRTFASDREGLTLYLDGVPFRSGDATVNANANGNTFTWSGDQGLSWSAGQEVKVRLTRARLHATLEDVGWVDRPNGQVRHRFELELSEPVVISNGDLRRAFSLTNGEVVSVTKLDRLSRKRVKGEWRRPSRHWRIAVNYTGEVVTETGTDEFGDDTSAKTYPEMTVTLPAKACHETGALCTDAGEPLAQSLSIMIEADEVGLRQPLKVRIAGVSANEEVGYVDIPLTLSRDVPSDHDDPDAFTPRPTADIVEVKFDVFSGESDVPGIAKEGEDFVPVTDGLRVFAPGETEIFIRVLIIDDGVDTEGAEAFSVRLTGARLVDPATGRGKGPVDIADTTGAGAGRISILIAASDGMQQQQQRGVPPRRLTAAFRDVPASHDGQSAFTFDVVFSESFKVSYKTMRDDALTVTNGRVTGARRLDNPHHEHRGMEANREWRVTVEPAGNDEVSIQLPPTTDCAASGALCTADGRMLASGVAQLVAGPPSLSIADAEVREAADAALDFEVSLSRAVSETVTVDWATSDGTATAGSDYTAGSGTLTFTAGQTSKTVSVAVLDDSHDEGSETLTLTLSNVSGANAWLKDATATGTIQNDDHMPKAWLARFGRTVAEQVIEAVEGRMRGGSSPGVAVTLAGERIGGALGPAATGGDPDTERRAAETRVAALSEWLQGEARDEGGQAGFGARAVSNRDLLIGSSFSVTGEASAGGAVSLWGRGAHATFDGRDGDLTLDGEVTSAMIGADWARDAWTAGLLVSHSRGEGGYRAPSGDGTVSSSVTGLYPWGRFRMNERVTVWGVAGYGAGELTLTPENPVTGEDDPAMTADLSLAMGAVGLRGVVLAAPAGGGPELAVKTDAMAVRTSSEKTEGMAAAEADVTRLRLGLEGIWRGIGAGGGTLTPRAELGVRHDGGDAETGFGLDLGGGLAWSHPETGIRAEVSGRGLLTHESDGFRERGIAGSFGWDPTPGSDRGPSLSLTQTMGASASGGADALLGRRTLEGLAANDDGDELERRRLELRLGYGFAAFGDRFTSMPEIGLGLSGDQRQYSLGWRLARDPRPGGIGSLEFSFEARRQEYANDNARPEHSLGFRLTARF